MPLTKELLASASSARSQYRLYLENERKNKESALKRKAVEEELLDLRTQHELLSRVCESLENDADKLAEQVEGKAGSKMAELIIKSNNMYSPFLCHLNSHSPPLLFFSLSLPLSLSISLYLSQSASLSYQLMNTGQIVTTSLLKFVLGHVQTAIHQ